TEAMPVLVEARAQGHDQSWGGLDIRTFLSGEQSAGRFSVHSIVLAPGASLPPSYHVDAHAYYLVVDGDGVELQIGKLVDKVEPRAMGYAPPLTRQGLRNGSARAATVLAVYSPAGVERAFEEAHAYGERTGAPAGTDYQAILSRYGFRFDDAPLENDDLTNVPGPGLEFEISGPGDMEALRRAFSQLPAHPRLVRTPQSEFETAAPGVTFRKQLLVGEDSAGQAMINLLGGEPGMGAPPHHQPTEEEFFFIVRGQLRMTCATETKVLDPGAFAFCPRNCTHGFKNLHPSERTTFITLNSPAGHERSMVAVRQLRQKGASPEKINALSADGGFIWHQPPV
ncbi:MAG TPA: cupin domain-containing protein, partial [Caulobacteraceae bacterium]|nr:cupin domain-containing protein [Caulobacteraceae bacterium]